MPSSEVMHKFKHGTLRSGGPGGKKVTSRAQAQAILMSEKDVESKHGGKYPEPKATKATKGKGKRKRAAKSAPSNVKGQLRKMLEK